MFAAAGTPAQEKPAALTWFFGLADLPNGEWGSIYHVYDSRQSLRFQLGFRNESNRSVHVSADVLSRVRFVLNRGSSNAELRVEWETATHSSLSGSDTVPVGLAVTLGPGDSYGRTGVLTAELADGEQLLRLNVTAAAEAVTWSDGTPWRGRLSPDLAAVVRVLKPQTVEERHYYHLIESSVALRRGDTEAALRHAREVLQESPNDQRGHYALANIFLKLGRFREAILELELVKPPRPDRSLIYDQLAYAYLAVGDEHKAEATLREIRSADDSRAFLEKMRELLRRDGVIK
jgi:tetratricopeptide (TPR) repeat protein